MALTGEQAYIPWVHCFVCMGGADTRAPSGPLSSRHWGQLAAITACCGVTAAACKLIRRMVQQSKAVQLRDNLNAKTDAKHSTQGHDCYMQL